MKNILDVDCKWYKEACKNGHCSLSIVCENEDCILVLKKYVNDFKEQECIVKELEDKCCTLENTNYDLKEELEDLKEEVDDLESQLEEYKNNENNIPLEDEIIRLKSEKDIIIDELMRYKDKYGDIK